MLISSEDVTRPTAEWAAHTGPVLLRITKVRELTAYERKTLEAIKGICPCHRTDHPEEYSDDNGETCAICGRPIGIVSPR